MRATTVFRVLLALQRAGESRRPREAGSGARARRQLRAIGINERFGIPAPFTDAWVDGNWYARAIPIRGQYVEGDRAGAAVAKAPAVFVDL